MSLLVDQHVQCDAEIDRLRAEVATLRAVANIADRVELIDRLEAERERNCAEIASLRSQLVTLTRECDEAVAQCASVLLLAQTFLCSCPNEGGQHDSDCAVAQLSSFPRAEKLLRVVEAVRKGSLLLHLLRDQDPRTEPAWINEAFVALRAYQEGSND